MLDDAGFADTKSTGQRPELQKPKDVFGLHAKWLKFANERQLRRLAKLHVRIERRLQAVEQMREERNAIMMVCVRRMRRARGLRG